MDKYIGRLLDNRYEILEVIGSGGMAVVYKARCHRLNRLVAIKILKDDFLDDEDFRRRFHAESQAVAMLSHPNIVSVYDVSTSVTMESDYIVMELIEGITLKQYMEKKGVLNWKETLHFAMQIAKALEHAHSRGVVHRDIKPHNVMVLKNGSVKVADFGIARMMTKGDTLTKEALGSVHYISPEQAKGGRVDNRSDIYSLGVVMYEMMSGRPPYEGESPVSVAIAHINGGAILPSALNPNIPGGMEQIIMKAMAHDLSNRYSSATELLADMDEFRKNPALLFDYQTSSLDDAVVINRKPIAFHPDGGNSVAERHVRRVQEKEEKKVPKTTPVREERSSEGNGSRVATAAIIACSVVAVIAIAVFLFILLGGGLNSSDVKMVTVPNMIGKYEEALPLGDYKKMGLSVKVGGEEYHEEYEAGRVIRQEPVAGLEVPEGTTVLITVSKGGDPMAAEIRKMQNLVGNTEADAVKKLEDKNLDLDIAIVYEYSPTEAGKVVSTDPAEGEPLTEKQKVTLIISLGSVPQGVDSVNMPSLEGRKYEDAIKVLVAYGFPTPNEEWEYSTEVAENRVISQSAEAGKETSLTTVVTLVISKGPEPEPEPTETEPVETEPVVTEPPTEPPVEDPTDPPEPTAPPTEPPTETPDTDPPVDTENAGDVEAQSRKRGMDYINDGKKNWSYRPVNQRIL